MEVTISIINYNYGKFLANAIESALNQDSDIEFEVLLIDDGSTDNSDEVAAKYIHRSNFRISKSSNQGFGKSLSRAIAEAQGKYIFFLDADDYLSTNKLTHIVPFLQKGFLYVSDTSQYINESGERIDGGAYGSTSTVAVNKGAVLPLMPVENEIYFYSLFIMGRGKILTESYTYYRFHGNNMTNRKIPGKWQAYLSSVTHNLANKLSAISSENSQAIWNITSKDISRAISFFKSRAYYNELEANLELHQWKASKKNYTLMMLWAFRYRRTLSLFHIKMFLRTMFMKPSFPKN